MASILEMAKSATMHQAELIVKDAAFIPKEKFSFCPMGCAHTAADILTEVAGANVAIANSLTGAKPDEEFGKKVGQASTLEEIGDLVLESARIVVKAIESFSDADLDRDVTLPWGMTLPISQAIFLPVSHMTYHDGQINYIQTLLGDSAFHWAE